MVLKTFTSFILLSKNKTVTKYYKPCKIIEESTKHYLNFFFYLFILYGKPNYSVSEHCKYIHILYSYIAFLTGHVILSSLSLNRSTEFITQTNEFQCKHEYSTKCIFSSDFYFVRVKSTVPMYCGANYSLRHTPRFTVIITSSEPFDVFPIQIFDRSNLRLHDGIIHHCGLYYYTNASGVVGEYVGNG